MVALFVGCGSSGDGDSDAAPCPDDVRARLDVLLPAIDALVASSSDICGKVASACSAMVVALGGIPIAESDPFPEHASSLCDQATALIEPLAQAPATLQLAAGDVHCAIDHQQQLACEPSCLADPACSVGSVESRCDATALAVECSGTCDAGATCEGSLEAPAACDGSCTGSCEGTCAGAASQSTCATDCKGTCDGDCTLAAAIACGSGVYCLGGCDAPGTGAVCEAALRPPACEVDSACETICAARAAFAATCTAPAVHLLGADGLEPEQIASLEANLSTLLRVHALAGLQIDAATDLLGAIIDSISRMADQPGCDALHGTDISSELRAALDAYNALSVCAGRPVVQATGVMGS